MRYPAYPVYKDSGVEWLGEVPEHWELKRLKISVKLADVKTEADEEKPLPYVGMEHIESWTGRLLPLDSEAVPAGIANLFKAGSTLFGKLRPYLAKAYNPDFDGLCSTELLVLRGEEVERQALLYILLSDGFIKLVDSSTYGSKMPRANWDFIGNCIIPIPPRLEQRAIADFLDTQVTQIDALLAKKQKLIDKLKEKRTALISRTVTRGLPPEIARAAGLDPHRTMKDSGITSITEIPNDWRVTKVWLERVSRHLEYQDGNHGELHPKAEDYVDDGIPFVMANHITQGQIDFQACNYIAIDQADSLRIGFAKTGDVLLTHKGTIGRVGMVQENQFPYVMLTPQVTYYRCLNGIFNRYLFYYFQGIYWQDQMSLISGLGTTRGYIGLLDQRYLVILLPAMDEQKAIASFLDGETALIDQMIIKTNEAIERLQEYRAALITAAVTGKIDVRGGVA